MSTIGYRAGTLDSGGGLELYELATARELSRRGWGIVVAHDVDGDLSTQWEEIADRKELIGAHTDLSEVFAGVDLMYVHQPNRIVESAILGRSMGIPTLGHLHLPPEGLREGWKARVAGRRRRGHRELELVAPQSGPREFISVSAFNAQQWRLMGLGDDRLSVVANGIDIERFHPASAEERAHARQCLGIETEATVVTFIGRIDPRKGIAELIEAHHLVRDRLGDNVVLVVCGRATRHLGGDDSIYTQELKDRCGPEVIWLGHRSDPELVLAATDLAVVPSLWPEPFGLVVPEAMASAVPVIVANRGALPEVLGPEFADQVVEPSASALAESIIALASSRERLAQLGQASRAHAVSHFSLSLAIDGVEERIRSLLSSDVESAATDAPPGGALNVSKLKQKIEDKVRYGTLGDVLYRVRALLHRPRISRLSGQSGQHLAALKATGGFSISLDDLALGGLTLGMAEEFNAEVASLLPSLPDREAHHVTESLDPLEGRNTALHCFSMSAEDLIEKHPALVRLGLEESILDLVEGYLGVPPALTALYLRKDIGGGNQVGTRFWHLDTEDVKVIRMMVYLSDVTIDDGPFEYVPLAETAAVPELHERALRSAGDPIFDEEFRQHVPESDWVSITGPAGTVLLADNAKCFHHGRVHDSERTVLIYTYTSRHPRYPKLTRNTSLDADLSERQRNAMYLEPR